MANKLLKSLKFPDLSDTYVIPEDLQADIASVESSMTATKNYAVGDLIIVNGTLYRAIASIASGATLTVGTNVAATTIEAELKAKPDIDGNYPDMTVGNAEQLVSTVFIEDSEPYKFRTSGGSADIGDREYEEIIGGTIAWNQWALNGNFAAKQTWNVYNASYAVANNEATVTNTAANGSIFQTISAQSGHKYLVCADCKIGNCEYVRLSFGGIPSGKSYSSSYERVTHIHTFDSAGSKYLEIYCYGAADTIGYAKNAVCFDLTQMFGSTVADFIYSLEQANAGAGVAWFRKLFPNPYYAYNAGELLSVGGLQSHDMVGFNQWDEETEDGYISDTGALLSYEKAIRSKNYFRCIDGATYYYKRPNGMTGFSLCFYDGQKNFINRVNNMTSVVAPSNACYAKISMYNYKDFSPSYNHDVCINLSWDGERDGEYEPYVKHSYPLDSSLTLRGVPKLDANNSLYYDGDEYASDGTVTRRFGIVDLGSLTWSYNTTSSVAPYFYAVLDGSVIPTLEETQTKIPNVICSKYVATKRTTQSFLDGTFTIDRASSTTAQLQIKDSAYTDYTTFKTAMSGVYLVYELATPTTETADPYQNPQIVDDFGTEEYVSSTIVPVGHDTKYANNLRAKLEMSPESPSDNGDFIVRHANGQNTYVPLLFPAAELPAAPTENGNYRLKCTVSSGNATYTWESIS